MLPVAVHVGGAWPFGVDDGVADAADDGGDDDVGGGVVVGGGLSDDAQAPTSSPTTIVVATREKRERIPNPPDGVLRETFGRARCCVRHRYLGASAGRRVRAEAQDHQPK
jgi:hypothetical protein